MSNKRPAPWGGDRSEVRAKTQAATDLLPNVTKPMHQNGSKNNPGRLSPERSWANANAFKPVRQKNFLFIFREAGFGPNRNDGPHARRVRLSAIRVGVIGAVGVNDIANRPCSRGLAKEPDRRHVPLRFERRIERWRLLDRRHRDPPALPRRRLCDSHEPWQSDPRPHRPRTRKKHDARDTNLRQLLDQPRRLFAHERGLNNRQLERILVANLTAQGDI